MRILKNLKLHILYRYFTEYHIIAFPKSGTAWVRFFLASYLSEYYKVSLAPDFDRNLNRKCKQIPRLFFSHVGNISGHQAAYMAEHSITKVLHKTILKLKGKKIIFLTRDPRDVVVSYYFHLHKHEGRTSLSSFIRSNKSGLEAVVEYMNEWNRHKNIFETFSIFSYEERTKNPENEFRRLLDKLSIPIDDDILLRAIENSSFENMKKIQEKKTSNHKMFLGAKKDDPESGQIRKGKVGGYVEYLSAEDILYADLVLKKLDQNFNY